MTVCFWKRRYPIKAALRSKTVTIKNERTLKFPWHTIPEDGILRSLEYEIRFDTEKEITTISSKIGDKMRQHIRMKSPSNDIDIRFTSKFKTEDVFHIIKELFPTQKEYEFNLFVE